MPHKRIRRKADSTEPEIIGNEAAEAFLARPVETQGEYETRVERQNAFFELQRDYMRTFLKEGAEGVEDFYESRGFDDIFYLMGRDVGDHCFMSKHVLGPPLSKKLEKYSIKIPRGMEDPEAAVNFCAETAETYMTLFDEFNPSVLYAAFFQFASMEDGTNLVALRQYDLEPGERACLISRAESMLDALEPSSNYYLRRGGYIDPWDGLKKKIQTLIARANPMLERDYIKTGKVVGWVVPNDYYNPGMLVETPDVGEVTIRNCENMRKFGHLRGGLIRYHFRGYERTFDNPYGNLVSTSMRRYDDVKKLPQPKQN